MTATAQAMDALAYGNTIRYARADVKTLIGGGLIDLRGMLLDTPDWAQGMKLHELLEAQPRFGPSRTRKLCSLAGIFNTRVRLGEIQHQQRARLVRLLEERR